MLNDQQIETYKNEGLVVSSTRLSNNKIKELNSALDKYLIDHKDENNEFVSGLYERDSEFLKFALYPEIINEVKQLIGEDIILWGSSLFCKAEKTGNETPWHQDGEYWPIKPLESLTVWVAIDEVKSENGPLQYIPGSHLDKKLVEHKTLDKKNITLNQTLINIDEIRDQAKSVKLNSGMFSIHDLYLFHGSQANYSGKRRAGLTYRYMPASCFFDHQGAKEIEKKIGYSLQRQLHLVSGKDRATNKIYKDHTL
jgi:ectoine hydroxylase-related dioxygenase (phytanoyl-CoA dioxygenase family)